jgi:hypothetical protein
MTMRSALLILPLLLACNDPGTSVAQVEAAQETQAPEVPVQEEFHPDSPFKDLPLRYDGYYREQLDNLLYLVRFFPEGRAVLVNGTTEVEEQLPPMLHRSAEGDPAMGYYNVMVTVEGDSMFFVTRPTRGEISYRGTAPDRTSVRFLRHSHITGVKGVKEYLFIPDRGVSQ